jgi:nucleotide-binding universal stress UspA family protein
MGDIVVGIDGSEHSRRALRWAVDEARLRKAAVDAVYAYEYTPAWQTYAYSDEVATQAQMEVLRERMTEEEEAARTRAQGLVDRVVADLGDTGEVSVTAVAVQDRRPARALVERSEGSDMLVVGSRGRGGFTGLVLGSVSQQCAHHAKCPLVIIGDQD